MPFRWVPARSFSSSIAFVGVAVIAIVGASFDTRAQSQQPNASKPNKLKPPAQMPQQGDCSAEVSRLNEFNKRLQERLTGFSEQAERKISEQKTLADTCMKGVTAPEGSNSQGAATELPLEIIKLHSEIAALQKENQQLRDRSTANIALPCAAIKMAGTPGDQFQIQAMVTTDLEADQLRKRRQAGQNRDSVQIELLRATERFCLKLAGDFVLATEGEGGIKDGRPEVVYEPKTGALFRDWAPLMIPSDRCADAAAELRNSGLLGKAGDEDFAIWAQRDNRLVICKEDRAAPLDAMWNIAAGRPEGRAALLVLRFEVGSNR
jgi:hypothetical protein